MKTKVEPNKLLEEIKNKFSNLSLSEAFAIQEYVMNAYSTKAKDANVERMRKMSGEVNGNLLEMFIYVLLRDYMSAGSLEGLVLGLSNANDFATTKNKKFEFTNGWLGMYAKDIAQRLLADVKTGKTKGK